MGLARRHSPARAARSLLGSAVLLLAPASAQADWSIATPPAEEEYWEVTRVHFTSAREGWAVGSHYGADKGGLAPLTERRLDQGRASERGRDLGTLARPSRNQEQPKRCRKQPFHFVRCYGLHFSSASDGWVVGYARYTDDSHSGVLLHCQDGAWTAVTPPAMSGAWALGGVHFSSADEGWAVGGDYADLTGALLHCTRALFPAAGTIGTAITIRGSGCGPVRGKVLVSGNATKVAPDGWTEDTIVSLITKVPPPGGPYDVMVVPSGSPAGIIVPNPFFVRGPEVGCPAPSHGRAATPVALPGRSLGTALTTFTVDS